MTDQPEQQSGFEDPIDVLRALTEFTALIHQLRAQDLTSEERAALRQLLAELNNLSRSPEEQPDVAPPCGAESGPALE